MRPSRAQPLSDAPLSRPSAGGTLAVAAGGAAGSLARVAVVAPAAAALGVPAAAATLVVNVVGCVVIGMVSGPRRGAPAWLATGVLGGFTTFSGWVLDVGRLLPHAPAAALLLLLATPSLCIGGCLLGQRVRG